MRRGDPSFFSCLNICMFTQLIKSILYIKNIYRYDGYDSQYNNNKLYTAIKYDKE